MHEKCLSTVIVGPVYFTGHQTLKKATRPPQVLLYFYTIILLLSYVNFYLKSYDQLQPKTQVHNNAHKQNFKFYYVV